MERREQNKHIICDNDNDDDNDVDDGNDNGDDDGVNNGDDGIDNSDDDGAVKHLSHLSQAADCCLMERSEQNKHVICNKADDVDNGVDNDVDNADNDIVDKDSVDK
eukprot:9303734-Ditylum_brightwellii.AAC.1